MSRAVRSGVLVVLVVAALAGCGRGQDPAMSGPVPSTTTTAAEASGTVPPPDPGACSGEEPAAGEDLTLAVAHGELRSGAPVTWTLTVTNGGDAPVELVFGTGQDGDVALSQGETEVYRWSADIVFTQAVRCQVLASGATATYELQQPVLDVAPGEYQLRASLAAAPKPFEVATQVSVR